MDAEEKARALAARHIKAAMCRHRDRLFAGATFADSLKLYQSEISKPLTILAKDPSWTLKTQPTR